MASIPNTQWQTNPLLQTGGSSPLPQNSNMSMAPNQSTQPPQQPTQLPPTTVTQPTPRIDLEPPSQSPTVITTDSLRTQLEEAQTRLNQIKTETATPAPKQPQPTTPTPTVTPSKDTAPDPIATFTAQTTKLIEDRKNEFNRYLQRSDNLLRSQVSAIQAQFDIRRDQAQAVAQNAMAASSVLGSRTGRARYAPEIQRSINTGQENALLTTLSEIDALELATIAAAEEAAFSRDWTTFTEQMESIDNIQKEREKTLNELTEAMRIENERRQDEIEMTKNESLVIEQIMEGLTDPIEIFSALDGTVPFDVIRGYTDTLPAPTSTDPVKLGRYDTLVDPVTGAVIARGGVSGGGGGITVDGQFVPSIGGLSTETATMDDISMMPISESAKAYVRLFVNGRLSQEEILQRLSGDKADRELRNEVIGVVSQLEQPQQVNKQKALTVRLQAETALDSLDVILKNFTDRGFFTEAFDLSNTSVGRAITQFVPGTNSRDIRAAITSLEGMVAFDELQKMRENSPTGGALGAVTERELALLAAQRGSMDITQSTKQFVTNMQAIRKSFLRVKMINDPTTTVQKYKANFPDASEQELDEIRRRNQQTVKAEASQLSNRDLLLGGSSPTSPLSIPSVLQEGL